MKPISLSLEDSIPESVAPPEPLPQREEERSPYATGAQLRIDLLRAEMQRSAGEEEAGAGFLSRLPLGMLMKPRLLLVVVAIVAGGLAAFLAVQRLQPASAPVEEVAAPAIIAPPTARVLVATQDIGMGQRLSESLVAWQEWPETALRPEYITDTATPEAITDMSGAVARYEFFPGEPIRRQKLVLADQGYLSAVLEPGMRGVSVMVAPEAASGGFIVPNDHVDIVLARTNANGLQVSETILRNVRVLAIDARLGETGTTGAPADPANPRAEIFAAPALATLELNSAQAEVIVNATALGKLSLVLRSLSDFMEGGKLETVSANQAIRMTSPFWLK
ncbi:MAG: Flp pilus assembly protein CpaB [Devosia sp.]